MIVKDYDSGMITELKQVIDSLRFLIDETQINKKV